MVLSLETLHARREQCAAIRLLKMIRVLIVTSFLCASAACTHDNSTTPSDTGFDQSKIDPLAKLFFADAENKQAGMSPDGRYIAVIRETNGSNELVIIDRVSKKPSFVAKASEGEEVAFFDWVMNDRILFGVGKKTGVWTDENPNTKLYFINADGSKRTAPWENEASGYRVLAKNRDSPIILVEKRHGSDGIPKPHKVNVFTGRAVYTGDSILKDQFGQYFADQSGEIRFASRFQTYIDKESVSYFKDPKKGTWENFAPVSTATSIAFLGMNLDRSGFYVQTVLKGSDKAAVYHYDIASKKLKETFAHPVVDIEEVVKDQDENPVGVVVYDGKPSVHFFQNNEYTKTYQALAAALPDHIVTMLDQTQDLNQILLSARSDRDPGAYYLYNKDKGELVFQYQMAPKVDRKKLVPMEPIKYQARDGRTIHGYLTKPEGKNLPLLMIVHGGPMARDYWGYQPEAQYFAAKGFAVMQVNFRGSTGYGQDHETSGHLKQGTTMQDDVTDGTLWAIKQGIAAADKTCIYGASYGGYAAIQGAVREPDLYKCAIGYVGVYDLPLTWKEGDFHSNRRFGKAFLSEVWGEEEKDLIARSPAYHVDRIKIPVMIAHGEDDQRVPFTHAKVLRKKLEEANKPFIWLTKPGEGHGFRKEPNRFELYTTMINYMNNQLGLGQAKP